MRVCNPFHLPTRQTPASGDQQQKLPTALAAAVLLLGGDGSCIVG
jgi:hypothetical protein